MEESAECSDIWPSALSVNEVFLNDKMEHVEVDGLLDGDITAQEKNKKKKKKHKGLPSPRRILAFNTTELSKLDEHKAEMKKCDTCVVKNLSKSASFPSNAIMLKDNVPLVEGSGDSEDSREYAMLSSTVEKISMLTRVTSFPLKSALRGGYEELGIGPRPKLQVKWAPSVWEPPCSTISHTVNKSRSKKDPKHGKKGKSSHDDPHKRHDKKKHHKTKCHSGSSIVRRHGECYNHGGKEAASLLQADVSNCNEKSLTSGSAMALPELESKETDVSDASYELVTETGGDVPDAGLSLNLESSLIGGVHYPLESTCGGSLFEPERLACNFLYRQAM